MERFLVKPHLPQGRVSTVAVGEKYTDAINNLESLGIKTVKLSKNSRLDDEINCHADLQLLHLGNNAFVVDFDRKNIYEYLTERGANVILQKRIGSPYPGDIILNKLLLNGRAYGKFNAKSGFDCDFLPKNTAKINTKQGYTKCSVCVVGESAVICDDRGISTLLKKSQIDVLEVSKGDIYLSELHCGFIGGTGFKIAENLMFFNGNLREHSNYKEIVDFLNNYRIEPVFDSSRRLTDIGGAVQLFERL